MNTNRKTQFIAGIMFLMILLSACGAEPAPAAAPTLTISEMQTIVAGAAATATPECPPFSAETGQPLVSSGDGGCNYYEGTPVSNPPTRMPNSAPTAQSVVIDPTQPSGTGVCEDGKLVLVYNAPVGTVLDRTPVGEAGRVDIMEISKEPGKGQGNHDRAIIDIPTLGNVWMVDVKAGADTIMTRGFCGTNEAVADWAVKAHVPSLQQASRDANGNQPPADEIGVYRLDFEARAFIVVKAATSPNAPSPEEVLSWIEVSFNEGGNISAVPMHVVYP